MKTMTELVVAEVNKIGLKINTGKTKIMRIRSSDNQCVIIDDTDLEEIEKFTYLRCKQDPKRWRREKRGWHQNWKGRCCIQKDVQSLECTQFTTLVKVQAI